MTLGADTSQQATDRLIGHSPMLVRLTSVDGYIAYDLPGARASGGGTRLAADIDTDEVLLLARAMTYKLAAVGIPVGGAKIGLRAHPAEREAVLERFRAEVAPLLGSGRLMTGPDLGTCEADFRGLPTPGGSNGIAAKTIEGVPAEEYLTGFGGAVAIQAALGSARSSLDGRRVVLEGFGKVGGGVAREVVRRGGRIVALSTIDGCVVAPTARGFAIERLMHARDAAGDALVHQLGVPVYPREALWRVPADVVVPGARPGVIDAERAATLRAHAVVPVANAPYTAAGLDVLAERGIAAHADFIASAGGAIAYLHADVARAASVDTALDALERHMTRVMNEAASEAVTPYAGAVAIARRFLASWRPPSSALPAPPLAG
jgi:glutamate dehydrogenase (NAD(P)+)